MKKYTNITSELLRVEFKDYVQFLRRGQSVTSGESDTKYPEGILVETVGETKKTAKKKK